MTCDLFKSWYVPIILTITIFIDCELGLNSICIQYVYCSEYWYSRDCNQHASYIRCSVYTVYIIHLYLIINFILFNSRFRFIGYYYYYRFLWFFDVCFCISLFIACPTHTSIYTTSLYAHQITRDSV